MIRAIESQVDVLWRRMVTIWKAQVHFFSGSSQIIKSFNRANNHKRLQLCALLKFFDNVIQSYLLFFFPVYKHLRHCTHDIAPRHCTQTGVPLNYGKHAQSPSAGDSRLLIKERDKLKVLIMYSYILFFIRFLICYKWLRMFYVKLVVM